MNCSERNEVRYYSVSYYRQMRYDYAVLPNPSRSRSPRVLSLRLVSVLPFSFPMSITSCVVDSSTFTLIRMVIEPDKP